MALPTNVGGADKTFRIVLGLVLLGIALFAEMKPFWLILTLLVAAIALMTAFTRFCPLNYAVGIDSARKRIEDR